MTARGLAQLALILALVLAALYALRPLWGALIFACLLYLLLHPLVLRLRTLGWPRYGAIMLALGAPLLALGGLLQYLVREAANYLPRLSEDLRQLQTGLADMLTDLDRRLQLLTGVQIRLAEQFEQLQPETWLNTEQLLSSSGWVAAIAVNSVLAPVLAFFLLRDYRRLRDRALAALPNHRIELGWLLYRRIAGRLQSYLRGLLMQATILASVTATGFALAGFPSALLLGLLTGVAGLVPYLGPFLALVPPALVLLANPAMGLESLVEAVLVILVGFGFDNLVVIPFLLAGTVNVHPALALMAVLAAGHVAGIPGMVIIIPLLGMVGIVIKTLLEAPVHARPAVAAPGGL
jgi:putative permease